MLSIRLRRAAQRVARKPQTVASILAPFTRMKQQLQDLALQKGRDIATRDEQIASIHRQAFVLQTQNNTDNQEGQTALLAADRLQWMLENPARQD